MARNRHKDKTIEAALQFAEGAGWTVIQGGSHAWGQMRCRHNDRNCRLGQRCQYSVLSTPRNPHRHAQNLTGVVTGCIHIRGGEQADDDRV